VELRDKLLQEGGLAVDREVVGFERGGRRCGIGGFRAVAAKPVVQADAKFVEGKIGIKTLRAERKLDAAGAIIGEKIFDPCGLTCTITKPNCSF